MVFIHAGSEGEPADAALSPSRATRLERGEAKFTPAIRRNRKVPWGGGESPLVDSIQK